MRAVPKVSKCDDEEHETYAVTKKAHKAAAAIAVIPGNDVPSSTASAMFPEPAMRPFRHAMVAASPRYKL